MTDVGRLAWEEINLVTPGGNYGWPIFEGPDCRMPADCDNEDLLPPLFAYPHDATGGIVVVGGFVYSGQALPELQGKFVYADGTDRVWALYFNEEGEPEPEILVDGGLAGSIIHSLFEDEDGELYLVKAGPLYRLSPAEDNDGEAFPEFLSETGCFDPANPTQVAAGVIPYEVNSQFWTDGADKARWFALPDDGAIEVAGDGDLQFPPGSVLIKEFSLEGKRIETRLFARHDDGNWRVTPMPGMKMSPMLELVGPVGRELDVDGQNYTLPSRAQCLSCHTEAAGRSLGLEIQQQNSDAFYSSTGLEANQLVTWELIGLVE